MIKQDMIFQQEANRPKRPPKYHSSYTKLSNMYLIEFHFEVEKI